MNQPTQCRKRAHATKAVALAWLATSAEAFNVASNIKVESRSSSSRGSSRSSGFSRSKTAIGGVSPAPFSHPAPATGMLQQPWNAPPTRMSMSKSDSSSSSSSPVPAAKAAPPAFLSHPAKTLATMMAVASMAFGFIGGQPAMAADLPMAPAGTIQTQAKQVQEIRYSDFINEVIDDKIEKVSFSADGQRLVAIDADGSRVKMDAIPNDPELLQILTEHKVDINVMPASESGPQAFNGSLIFPAILLGGLLALIQTRANPPEGGEGGGPPPPGQMGRGPGRGGMGGGMGGGGPPGGAADFAKSQSKVQVNPDTGVTFADVAGCDNAKLELEEVVDFLQHPDRYTEIGAKIPRGVLMEGPPGTGKTLLAKAVAGEAGVPFIAVSGSEFVEMYVGVGASRVRDLFGKAKDNAPCIIFIDEIDAVGRQRGAGMAGGNDEREQTLNQILVQMDGFEGNPGIIVIAATNRADILDTALLRPGRFDRRVLVDLPNFAGRTQILKVHARGKPLAKDVDLEGIARRTPGFSGAQLQNLLNEAAIFTARKKREVIEWDDVDRAVDRLMVGVEKKGDGHSPKMREIVAYHEAGHAIIGALMPDYDMVQKVTVVPRTNGAGGLTFFSPSETRLSAGLYSRQYLEAQLAVALGGRLAEELIYGEDAVTTGASNDLQQVDNIARRMVTEWGMSEKVGPMVVGGEGGGAIGTKLQKTVDDEVERLTNNAYVVGKALLVDNKNLLLKLGEMLIEQDTVTAEELSMMIMDEGSVTMPPYEVYSDSNQYRKMPFQNYPVL